jgi:hypothetical protein
VSIEGHVISVPDSHGEALTINVIVFGDRVFGRSAGLDKVMRMGP